jgi:hypothetical protein
MLQPGIPEWPAKGQSTADFEFPQCVLIGYENSLLYLIRQPFTRSAF